MWSYVVTYTVDSRYLEVTYIEYPFNSSWKSGPYFNVEI